MAIIKCPECGHQISNRAPVCPSCGVEIAGKITLCKNCGEAVFKDQATCPNCGEQLKATTLLFTQPHSLFLQLLSVLLLHNSQQKTSKENRAKLSS